MIRGGLINPQLQRLGKISIGEKGEVKTSSKGKTFQEPKKLSFFTIRTHYRTEQGQLALDTSVMERLGPQPTELQIRLPFNQLERNFECELRYYKGGMKYCSGDGEQGYRREERLINGQTVYGDVKPFGPCGRTCPDFQSGNCKRFGALRVILEEQQQVGGIYEYRTTSRHSIENILSGLMTIQLQTGGILAWLPLTMKLVPQTVTMPNGKTTRAYIIQIVFRGSPQLLLETVRDILAIRAPLLSEIKALEAGIPQTEDDVMEAKETQDEFYPEQSARMLREEQSATIPAEAEPVASREEIIRAIVATLQIHRPYTGPREGAYTKFIPPEALEIIRDIFGVRKASDLKACEVDALQHGYADLLELLEPAEVDDELDIIDAETLEDEAFDESDEPSDDEAPLDDEAEAHLRSIQSERIETPEQTAQETPESTIVATPESEVAQDTEVVATPPADTQEVHAEGEDGMAFRPLDTDTKGHVVRAHMNELHQFAHEHGQTGLLEAMLTETPQMVSGRFRYCWVQIAKKASV